MTATSLTRAQDSTADLKRQTSEEFAQVGHALRERLEREAAGDFVGARIAQDAADTHRSRFLGLKRELERRGAATDASGSVATSRNPFSPGIWGPTPERSVERTTPSAAARHEAPLLDAAWDMYRPRASRLAMRESATDHQEPWVTGAPPSRSDVGQAAARDLSLAATSGYTPAVPTASGSSQPYRVYREDGTPRTAADKALAAAARDQSFLGLDHRSTEAAHHEARDEENDE